MGSRLDLVQHVTLLRDPGARCWQARFTLPGMGTITAPLPLADSATPGDALHHAARMFSRATVDVAAPERVWP